MKGDSNNKSEGENVIFLYKPFGREKIKVRREGEGIGLGEIFEQLEILHHAVGEAQDSSEEYEVDLALERIATLALSGLAMRAANGRKLAAKLLDESVRTALVDYSELAQRGNETIIGLIEGAAQVPGWVSTHKPLMDIELKFARDINQGSRFPFPRTKKTGQKGGPSILTAQNLLSNDICTYVCDMKREWLPLEMRERFSNESEYGEIHPILKKILKVPVLSLETVNEWFSLAKDILNDATDGQVISSEIMNSPPYNAMNTGSGNKFFDRLREGFEMKARALEEIQ